MELKDRIRKARNENDLSQRVVASLLNISPGAVGQWETGQTKPTLDNLIEFAAITGKPLTYFTGKDDVHLATIEVSDPEELALLKLWRRIAKEERAIHLRLLWSGGVPRSKVDHKYDPDPTGRKWRRKNDT